MASPDPRRVTGFGPNRVIARPTNGAATSIDIVVGRLSTPNSNTVRPRPTIGVSTRIVIPTNPMNRLAPTRSAPT